MASPQQRGSYLVLRYCLSFLLERCVRGLFFFPALLGRFDFFFGSFQGCSGVVFPPPFPT